MLLHRKGRGGMCGRCRSGFEVFVALVVRPLKAWKEQRKVGGRKDRVRSHRIPLADLIPCQAKGLRSRELDQ